MNSHPANPLDGPPNPANHVPPPYGNPTVQVIDPPDESPQDSEEAIPIISEEFAARSLILSYNVRSSFAVGLGTNYPIRSYGHRGITNYCRMTRLEWNTYRLDSTRQEGQDIRNLITSIYRSILHHQEDLIIHGRSSVYALPRSKKMWVGPISVLLAPFQVQLYIEKDRTNSASIWGDFSSSHRPHPDDEDYYVDLALNVAM